MLNPGCLWLRGIVKREWTVKNTSRNLAPVGHLTKRSRIDRRSNLGGDGFNNRQNRYLRSRDAENVSKIDRVLNDIRFFLQIRIHIDRRVCNDQRSRIARRVYDTSMDHLPF